MCTDHKTIKPKKKKKIPVLSSTKIKHSDHVYAPLQMLPNNYPVSSAAKKKKKIPREIDQL